MFSWLFSDKNAFYVVPRIGNIYLQVFEYFQSGLRGPKGDLGTLGLDGLGGGHKLFSVCIIQCHSVQPRIFSKCRPTESNRVQSLKGI